MVKNNINFQELERLCEYRRKRCSIPWNFYHKKINYIKDIIEETNKKIKNKQILNEIYKQQIISLITALEVYFRETFVFILCNKDKIKCERILESIRKDVTLLEINKLCEKIKKNKWDKSGLKEKERFMGISVTKRRDEIRKFYPDGKIIAAELGCFVSSVVGDMDQIEGIAAFGIDLKPILDGSQQLSPDRLIVADLNNMPHVPNGSFHYMLSFNCLSYTEPTKSFQEIYRVLKRGGIADLDLEF